MRYLVPALALSMTSPALASVERQVALVHLEARGKLKAAEIEPLEKDLSAMFTRLGWTVVWAENAVATLAIGVEPHKCLDPACRTKLAQALEAQLMAGGKIERRRDPAHGTVVDLALWIFDPGNGRVVSEGATQCTKCSAAEVGAAWQRTLRDTLRKAGFAVPDPGEPVAAKPEPAPSWFTFSAGSFLDGRMIKWYLGLAAVGLASVGVTFLAIDGPRFAANQQTFPGIALDTRDRLPHRYATFTPGLIMTSTAVGLLCASSVLHYLERRKGWGTRTLGLSASAFPGGASVSGRGQF